MIRLLLVICVLFSADPALALPEFVRLGYNGGCQSCHVSPTGGGALTGYGRTVAEETATFPLYEGSGDFLAGAAPIPDRVMVGGDLRYAAIVTPVFTKQFLMQNDVELAARAGELTFAASAGQYYEREGIESRRHYVLWTPSENVTVRAGRYMPAYGIMLSDHTLATRSGLGFNENAESYNLELGLHHEKGQLFATVALPRQSKVLLGDKVVAETPELQYLVRGSYFAGKEAQLGWSYRLTAAAASKFTHTTGPYFMWAPFRSLYLLGEYGADFEFPSDVRHAVFTELGWEPLRGVHLQTTYEYANGEHVPGAAVQLFPVAHVEMLARVKRQGGRLVPLLIFHSNL